MTQLRIVRVCCIGVWIASSLGACSVDVGILGSIYAGLAGSAGALGGFAGNAGVGTASPTYHCPPTSPAVTMPGANGYPTCTGRIASATFNNALCVCNGVKLNNALVTFGFDSAQGVYVPGQLDDGGAAVGINGGYQITAGATEVGGSLSIAGPDDVSFVGALLTRGDLRIAGNVNIPGGAASVARNAWLAGTYDSLGALIVAGELHHAQDVRASFVNAGSDTREPVTISKPCPCEAEELLDVEALVNEAKLQNDNKQHQIDANVLASINGEVQLTLPCGRFYLSEISGTGQAVIQVIGMTALFIDDSINLNGNLQIELAAGAEIDLLIRNDLALTGPMALGPQSRPAATRIFVGGANPIALTSPLIGNLYAPRARVYTTNELEVYGSLFASDFAGESKAKVVFDRAVLATDRNCAEGRPPAGTCSHCGSCSDGTACIDGNCTSCRNDDDCCGLAICANGSCSPLIELR